MEINWLPQVYLVAHGWAIGTGLSHVVSPPWCSSGLHPHVHLVSVCQGTFPSICVCLHRTCLLEVWTCVGCIMCFAMCVGLDCVFQSEEYRNRIFNTIPEDRPLFVQFCGNDAQTLLQAARHVQDRSNAKHSPKHMHVFSCVKYLRHWLSHARANVWLLRALRRCDAIDLNLGCPQEVAKRGGYGAFLMTDWVKVDEIVRTLVRTCTHLRRVHYLESR